ncbi:hypothetical protein [Yinghuangia seranimata]|uniref:hypothetical protein n=1 Tax=Yinghuangia seranimata TaxID=408067 RepID=UPI00248BD8E8|nr:hypothetical protein [Yinghuangia seranimata]MDI2132522.1 hypothetical protein [Yinghuangia seranimata]
MLAVAVAVTAALTAGCSSDDGGSSSSGLEDALGKTADLPGNRVSFEYGDLKAVRDANGGVLQGPYGPLTDAGLGDLASVYQMVPEAYGIDLAKADRAWSAGEPPDNGGVLEGSFDAAAVEGKLKGLNAKQDKTPSGASVWRTAPDHEMGLQKAPLPAAVTQFNVAEVGSGRIVHGPSAAVVDGLAHADGRTLADVDAFKESAACLGDVLAASLHAPSDDAGGRGGAHPVFTAAGVRGGKGKPATEVLCVPLQGIAAGQDPVAAVKDFFAKQSTRSGAPWRQLLSDVKVEKTGNAIRVTATPAAGRKAGVFRNAQVQGDLADLPIASGGS